MQVAKWVDYWGGFEWGKFRMGLEYNLVPKSTLQDTSGNNRGTISNSYLGIHLGFLLVEENGVSNLISIIW
jgi:hypothetical protein